MNVPTATRSWTRSRWWSSVVLLFLLQVGLIWWFSPHSPVPVEISRPMPRITLQLDRSSALPGQVSPFFLSHVTREGFSGSVWLKSSELSQKSLDWSAPPRWLEVQSAGFGASLAGLLNGLSPAVSPRLRSPAPELELPVSLPLPRPIERPSHLVIEGDLAARALAQLPALQAWTNESLLKPTVLEVGVDASGKVISMTMATRSELKVEGGAFTAASRTFVTEPAKSGKMEADQFAERIAAALRFRPLSGAPKGSIPGLITRGRLVFEWRTLPSNPTNSPPGAR